MPARTEQADQDAILPMAASADILAFQENTPEFVQSLEDKGLLQEFPCRLGTAEYEAYGTDHRAMVATFALH